MGTVNKKNSVGGWLCFAFTKLVKLSFILFYKSQLDFSELIGFSHEWDKSHRMNSLKHLTVMGQLSF